MFEKSCSLIGVVHIAALPGTPKYGGSVKKIVEWALRDVDAYIAGGVDALILENMHDVPYMPGRVGPEVTATMSAVAAAVKNRVECPLGVQVLAGANLEALAVAVANDLDFLRVEGFVFAHVGDEGMHNASAGALLRKRADLRAEHVKIFCDIKKKHSAHAITSDVSIAETAEAAEFFLADGVIISGAATGKAADRSQVESVRQAVGIKVLVGSGVTPENISDFASVSDALIVGTSAKYDGFWMNAVDVSRVKLLRAALNAHLS